MPLPTAHQLAKKHPVKVDGKVEHGPLQVDDRGFGVDVTSRSLTKKVTRRYYLFWWDDATAYTFSLPQTMNVLGSTVNANTVVFTVTLPTGQQSFELHHTSEATLRTLLGKYLVAIDQRAPSPA